jgi:hypothetical protein
MYVKASNQTVEKFPYTIGDLRKDNPNVSFPKNPSIETIAEYGVQEVELAPMIDVLPNQVAYTKDEPDYEGNKWVLNWGVRDLTQFEIDEMADQERSARNQRLSDCDWTQLSDAPLTDAKKAEWEAYRQALRDISDQSGFPYDINWPVDP